MSSPPNLTEDYALLQEMIEAATDAVETLAAVACINEEMLLTFDFFPGQQDPRQLYNYQIGYAYDWTPWWWYGFPTADSIELVRRPVQVGVPTIVLAPIAVANSSFETPWKRIPVTLRKRLLPTGR